MTTALRGGARPEVREAIAARKRARTAERLAEVAWLLEGGMGVWEVERVMSWNHDAIERSARLHKRTDVLELLRKAAA